MSEGPTAEPEPVPWGGEDDPFPVGTVINTGSDRPGDMTQMTVRNVERRPSPVLDLDGWGLMPKEVQGRINEEGWRVVGFRDEDGEVVAVEEYDDE